MGLIFRSAICIALTVMLSGCKTSALNPVAPSITGSIPQSTRFANVKEPQRATASHDALLLNPKIRTAGTTAPQSTKVCLTPAATIAWNQSLKGPNSYADAVNKLFEDTVFDAIDHTMANLSIGGFSIGAIFQVVSQIDRSLNAAVGIKSKNKIFPSCGNWCGPNFPRPNENPPVTDALDAVCRFHDLCYRKYGLNNCKCDEAFVKLVKHGRPVSKLSFNEMKMVVVLMGTPCRGGCKTFKHMRVCSK